MSPSLVKWLLKYTSSIVTGSAILARQESMASDWRNEYVMKIIYKFIPKQFSMLTRQIATEADSVGGVNE